MFRKITISGGKLVLLVWLFIIIKGNVPGKIEGKYFPAIEDFVVSVQESKYEKNASDVFIEINKIRKECAFDDINFYIYDRNGGGEQLVTLQSVYKGEEKARYAGLHKGVGPWVINTEPENLKDMSIAINHRCHIGFTTKTIFRIRDGELVLLLLV